MYGTVLDEKSADDGKFYAMSVHTKLQLQSNLYFSQLATRKLKIKIEKHYQRKPKKLVEE